MLVLLWIVRIYKWWLIAWVLLTWIPGVAGSGFHSVIGIPIVPVLAPFSFLSLGPVGLAPIIPLIALNYFESWLAKQAGVGQPEESEEQEAVDGAIAEEQQSEAQQRDIGPWRP